MNNNKVGIYCRLSDEDRFKKDKYDDSESIVNQKSMLLKYALKRNWEVINIYSDDDFSGADINRPAFQKLIEDCKSGFINIVLCKTQSRFSRDMEVIEKYLHNKFIEWNVRFVSVVDNADTLVEGNKKARQINGLINEWYLEDLSENIRSSLKNKREDGLYLGSFAPYGYKKDKENKNKLVIDPIASLVVKKIFSLYKSGMGYSAIIKYLDNEKIAPPSLYKKENGSKYVCSNIKNINKWSKDTIRKILKNEVYIGNLVQGIRTYVSYKNKKIITKPKKDWTYSYQTHNPIIDIKTWNCVQKKIKSHIRASKKTGIVYMLSKKVYCKECGKIFTRQQAKTKNGITYYMKCKGYRNSLNCSNKAAIRCDVLEEIIIKEINNQIDKYYNLDLLNKEYIDKSKKMFSNSLLKIENLEKEKNELNLKITKRKEHYQSLYDDKLNGIISLDDFLIFKNKFNKEINNYKSKIFIIDKELINLKSKENILKNNKMFEKYKHIDKLNIEIINEFIDVIKIGKIDSITNNRDIEIVINNVLKN